MKKLFISLSFLFVSAFAFGQSVTITPSNTTNIATTGGNIVVSDNTAAISIGSRRFNGTIASPTPVTSGQNIFNLNAGGYWSTGSFDNQASIRFNATENWSGSASGAKMSFWTTPNGTFNQIERMTINHDGNVGIGTTPSTKLHVSGGSSGVTPNTNSVLFVERNASNYLGMASPDADESGILFGKPTLGAAAAGIIYNTTNSMDFRTGGNLTRMVLNNAGNLGIGITTPNYNLHLHQPTAATVNFQMTNADAGTATTDGLRISVNQNSFLFPFATTINNQENAGLYFGTNSITRMAIDATGKVGIGTLLPSDKLHVSNGGTGDVYLKASVETSGFSGLRLQNVGGDWQLFTNEFDRMFLDYSTDNFVTRTGVLTFKPNGANFDVQPTTSDNVFLGSSALRWKEIWSVNPLNTSSDRRLKKDIIDIKYGLDEIMKLQAVSYHWKNNSDSKLHLGFIAQDVEKIVPEIVSKSGLSDAEYEKLQKEGKTITDTYGMEYTGLIPVLVKAVQEQQRIIEDKSLKISQLEQKLQKMGDLEARLSSIEASLNSKKSSQELKADK